MLASLLYALIRVLLDVFATSHSDQTKLQAEALALRRQVQVLERQIKRRTGRRAIELSWPLCAIDSHNQRGLVCC